MALHEFKTNPYPVKVYVCTTVESYKRKAKSVWEDASNLIPDGDWDGFTACRDNKSDTGRTVLVCVKSEDCGSRDTICEQANIAAHEATHAADYVFAFIGQDRQIGDEGRAYFVGNLAEFIFGVM